MEFSVTIDRTSLIFTSVYSVLLFGFLALFGMSMPVAALFGGSLIALNLAWTTLSARAAKKRAVERAAQRSALLAASHDA